MNIWIWWFLWTFASVCPIPTTKGLTHKYFKRFRVLYFFIGLIMGYVMMWWKLTDIQQFYWFIGVMCGLTFTKYIFTNIFGRDRENDEDTERRRTYSFPRRTGNLERRRSTRFRHRIFGLTFRQRLFRWTITPTGFYGLMSIIILVTLLIGMYAYIYPAGSTNNASYFNTMIKIMPEGMLPFNNSIPDNMVRLTTKELAESIVKQHMSPFGGERQILATDITMYQNRLVWVSIIGSTNTLADPVIYGLCIVDANDPNIPADINITKFTVGVGLPYYPLIMNNEIQGRAWISGDTSNVYGKSYVTQDDEGEWRYVVTTYTLHANLVKEYTGICVFDNNGNLLHKYKPGEIPNWVTQPYDEEEFLEGGIRDWGSTRRGNGFDFFASGFAWFIGPSSDRVERTEDTRYIWDPELQDIVAMMMVNPYGNKKTLAGVFKATRTEIQYYNLRYLNIISGDTAEDLIESDLDLPSKGQFFGTMPLLYTLEGRLVWYVPVYWAEEGEKEAAKGTMRLEGLGIVDATNASNKRHIEFLKPGMTGSQLVERARLMFIETVGENVVSGKVVDIQWDINPDAGKIYLFQVENDDGNKTNVWVYTVDIENPETKAKVMLTKTGDRVSIIIDRFNRFVRFADET